MAVAISVQPEPFLTNRMHTLMLWIGVALLVGAYSFSERQTVRADDPNLAFQNGYALYKGQPFTGQLVAYHSNGRRKEQTLFEDGKENGLAEGWYPNGQRRFERTYEKGHKIGDHQGWWENGRRRFEYHFENDEHEGFAREWLANGQRFREFYYHKGHEDGPQKMWNEDGTIRANYVVRNGRRYGLIGLKNCQSTSDEIFKKRR